MSLSRYKLIHLTVALMVQSFDTSFLSYFHVPLRRDRGAKEVLQGPSSGVRNKRMQKAVRNELRTCFQSVEFIELSNASGDRIF